MENMMHWLPFLANYEKSNCIFWTAKGVKYEISYFVTHFFEKRAVFEEIDAFFVETENFRSVLTQNIRETQCQRFRSARSVKSLKNADSCTKTSVTKTLPAGLALHVRASKTQISVHLLSSLPAPKRTWRNSCTYRICTHMSITNITFRPTSHFVASP